MLTLLLLLFALLPQARADDLQVELHRKDLADPKLTLLMEVSEPSGGPAAGPLEVVVEVDGEPVRVLSSAPFRDSGESFGTMMLFDTSCSMRSSMPKVKAAANRYVDGMEGGDLASVAWFDDETYKVDNPWTDDKARLREVIDGFNAVGNNTVLYDALNRVIERIAAQEDAPRYRAILLLSDGKDEGSKDPYTFDRAVRLAQEHDVPIHAVGFVPGKGGGSLDVMRALAADSGGSFALAEDVDQIGERFAEVQTRLHELQVVQVELPPLDVGDHRVEVRVRRGEDSGTLRAQLMLEQPLLGVPSNVANDSVEATEDKGPPLALIGGGVGLLVLVAVGVAVGRQRRPPDPVSPPASIETSVASPVASPVARPVVTTPSARHTATSPAAGAAKQPDRTMFRQPGSGPMVLLELDGGVRLPLLERGDSSVVGADPQRADVVVDRDTVSGRHISVHRRADGAIWIEDLGSSNGTWVNGKDIRGAGAVEVVDNQRVQLGTVVARLRKLG